MSATWWFHCNFCSARPSPTAARFFLVKCGHVLCVRCLQKAQKACDAAKRSLHCICCKKKVGSADEIGPMMNRRTLRFFMKVEDTMQEMAKEMKEIASYQQMQINLMVKALCKKKDAAKQKSLSQEKHEKEEKERSRQLENAARVAQEELKEMRRKYAKMEEELNAANEKLKEVEQERQAERQSHTTSFSLFNHSGTSKSLSFSSHEGSPNSSIFIANRLPTTRTPSRPPSRTSTPKYSFNWQASSNRPGTVKVGSIIPAGNIPRSMRTPKK